MNCWWEHLHREIIQWNLLPLCVILDTNLAAKSVGWSNSCRISYGHKASVLEIEGKKKKIIRGQKKKKIGNKNKFGEGNYSERNKRKEKDHRRD